METRYLNSARQSISPLPVNSRGSILIISLWSISLLSIFSVILAYGVRQEAMLVKRLDENDKLSFILEAGAQKAFLEFKKASEGTVCDCLKDAWNNDPAAFKDVMIGEGVIDFFYDHINEDSGSLEARYGIVDENRKININKADAQVLERLFQLALGFDEMSSQELAASIIDWRDADSMLSIPIGSAENSYYRDSAYPYEAKNADIESIDELLLVKGMGSDILEKLRGYITIYGAGRINVNTASKTVLLALGLSKDMADIIISFRSGKDKLDGTVDDNIFEIPADIPVRINEFTQLSESDLAGLNTVSELYLAATSESFTVKCAAHLNNKKYTARLVCVMDKNGKILYWQES
ncbi:MAG: type II secretion system protein GspK [Candidatus Omnitrophica bacterium]|nr:type II secretion system protein GspK [Candidatus Omnitrophota bacterium]